MKWFEKMTTSTKWPLIKFGLQTGFYFVVFLGLLYLYGYSGQGQGGFIYNEF